MIKKCELRFYR